MKGYDIRLRFYGNNVYFMMVSPQAQKEFYSYLPQMAHGGSNKIGKTGKIDRCKNDRNFEKIFLDCLTHSKTNEDWAVRRKAMNGILTKLFSAQHIPTIIEILDEMIQSWKKDEFFNMRDQ